MLKLCIFAGLDKKMFEFYDLFLGLFLSIQNVMLSVFPDKGDLLFGGGSIKVDEVHWHGLSVAQPSLSLPKREMYQWGTT